MEQDIRWKQRLSTYQTALDKLRQSVAFIHENFNPRYRRCFNYVI